MAQPEAHHCSKSERLLYLWRVDIVTQIRDCWKLHDQRYLQAE